MPLTTVLEIQGGHALNGTVPISGAKNAILPLMAATVLTDKPVTFSNVPNITDVHAMKRLLKSHGVSVNFDSENQITCRATSQPQTESGDPTISREFRASILLLGPLLARCGSAKIYLPGGDNIDSKGRPVDFHVTNLTKLGAIVESTNEYITAYAPDGLKGPGVREPIVLAKVSVGATQNTIMAACVASGTTIIEKASIEPETLDLVKMLNSMNANIQVDKTKRKITIIGKNISSFKKNLWDKKNVNICHTVIPDRIEAGTYAIAAAITGGTIELQMGNFSDEVILELLESEFWRLLAAGVEVTRTDYGVRISRKRTCTGQQEPITPVNVVTKPYPGFPTDLHPQWAALMCFSNGESWIEETVFDSRFKYVEQLQKLRAVINCDPINNKRVNMYGCFSNLRDSGQPAVVAEAVDIRAGAALILVALARSGITQITGLDRIKRGYEDFINKFTRCGGLVREEQVWI